jgi:hypothetical protein
VFVRRRCVNVRSMMEDLNRIGGINKYLKKKEKG